MIYQRAQWESRDNAYCFDPHARLRWRIRWHASAPGIDTEGGWWRLVPAIYVRVERERYRLVWKAIQKWSREQPPHNRVDCLSS